MESYIGFIYPSGFNFATRGYACCMGQILPISSHTAVFALLGTAYGGNGRDSFGLPDLQGRTAIGFGDGAGLPQRNMGEKFGSDHHILTPIDMPSQTAYVSLPEITVPVVAAVTQSGSATVSITAAKQAGNKPAFAGPSVQAPADGSLLAYGQSGSTLAASYLEGEPDNGTFVLGGASIELPQMAVSTQIEIPQQHNLPVAIPGGARGISLYQPSLAVNYQINLIGTFPSRS